MQVKQFLNERGSPAAHHFVLKDLDTGDIFFQSYDSTIVKIEPTGKVTLGKNWKYSITTSKYRNMFLGESTKETQEKLDSGVYLYDEEL